MDLRIEILKGAEIVPYTRALSEFRIKEFYEFPYLYVGTVEGDLPYTQSYASTPQGRLIVAFDGEAIVGMYSGMPLDIPESYFRSLSLPTPYLCAWSQKLSKEGIETAKYYYSGELMIDPALRKKKLGSRLMTLFKDEAKGMGFSGMIGVTSVRPADHPLRPKNYFNTDTVWGKHGFRRTPIIIPEIWLTRQGNGSEKIERNNLSVWINDFDMSASP